MIAAPAISVRCSTRAAGKAPGRVAAAGAARCEKRPSESVVSGEVCSSSSRPPIMRPGIAPGRIAPARVGSCTWRGIRVSLQWQGWQLAPANYATRNSLSSRAGRGR